MTIQQNTKSAVYILVSNKGLHPGESSAVCHNYDLSAWYHLCPCTTQHPAIITMCSWDVLKGWQSNGSCSFWVMYQKSHHLASWKHQLTCCCCKKFFCETRRRSSKAFFRKNEHWRPYTTGKQMVLVSIILKYRCNELDILLMMETHKAEKYNLTNPG